MSASVKGMHVWCIEGGCYSAEVSVRDNGHISMGTFCNVSNPRGHYVAVSPEQALMLVRFLCDHVPGVAEEILGKLTEM